MDGLQIAAKKSFDSLHLLSPSNHSPQSAFVPSMTVADSQIYISPIIGYQKHVSHPTNLEDDKH